MIARLIFLFTLLLILTDGKSQSFTSYHTGNTTDSPANALGGVCLMGGASEDDQAMKWFLNRANHGDVLVLRASGSDGYNSYMYSSLGVSLNSVETIVCNNATASEDPYVLQKINRAEAIWFAGGDQWDYVSYWRGTSVDSLINLAIQNRNIVVGGTSAGMAILGGFYFSAQNGTVTSAAALSNPYDPKITVSSTPFLQGNHLEKVITDTHYDDPDRKGRHVTFLARILLDLGIEAKGIACDEYTAVCIQKNGLVKVFGEYPSYDDNAYFIQTNCELLDNYPENCSSGNPLDWNLGGQSLKVYKVKGTPLGTNTFDLSDWKTGSGGVWQNWYITNGTLVEQAGTAISCSVKSIEYPQLANTIQVSPNPFARYLTISSDQPLHKISLMDFKGHLIKSVYSTNTLESMDVSSLKAGFYLLKIVNAGGTMISTIVKE